MIYVRDLAGNEYRAQATITNDYELNGNQSFEATFLPSRTNREFIADIAELWTLVDHDGVEHKVTYAKRQGAGDSLTVAIQGVPRFFDVLDTSRIYTRYDEHMTAMVAFTRIFEGLPFTFQMVDSFDAVDWEGFGDGESRMETFKRALNRYGAEFRIVGNVVYLHAMVGNDTQIQYRHRLNADNIVMENDASAMYTFARGYGDYGDGEGGEDWQNAKLIREYTSPLAKVPTIGIRHAPPIKNGNITDKNTMDAALKTLVDESLKISVSADIHDLRAQGYPQAQPALGDRVFLIDDRIGLNDEVRVVDISITRNWRGRVIDFKLTFGTPGLSRRYQSQLSSAMSSITDLLAGKIRLPAASVYDEAMRNAVTAIQNAQTELEFPEQGGIIAKDKTNPNKQVWYNAAGFMVSKDGGATAEAAITGEGVVAEKIVGRSIIGVNLTSADATGFFHVTGPYAQFYDMLTRRTLDMSPTGIYGYEPNNNNAIFRVDRTLVTSSALGTSVANVYLAAQSGFEARVVDMAGIPGDGLVDSYKYLPLRASGFYGNFWNVNSAIGTATNLYARPLTNGELRVTLNGTTDQYRDFRAREVFTNSIRSNALYGETSHLYMRMPGELRVTADTSLDSYRPVRAAGFLGTYIDLDAVGAPNASHIYVRPAGDPGELRVTVRGTTDVYRPVRAREFITDTSDRDNKTDITKYTTNTLDVLRKANVYNYRRANDTPDAPMQLGLMIDEMPEVTHSESGDSFALYALNSYTFKAVKDTLAKVDALESRIRELEAKP